MKGKGLKPRKAISLHGHQRAQDPRGLKDQAEPGRLFRSGWGDSGPDDVGVPRQPESIPGSEEAMVTSLCHRLRFLGGWEKRGLGGAGRGSHTVA